MLAPSACHAAGLGFSVGFAVDDRVRAATETLNAKAAWMPAIDSDGKIRDGAWVAEATGLVGLDAWPEGTRLIPGGLAGLELRHRQHARVEDRIR